MNYKNLVDSIVHSEVAQNFYNAVSTKWGSVGIVILLVVCILVGALVFGYDVADIQSWFSGLGQ